LVPYTTLFRSRVLINQGYGCTELDLVTGKLRNIDNLSSRHQVFQLVDPSFVKALRFLGCMILGIFREVSMRPRFSDRLNDPGTFGLLAPAKFFLELVKTARCHRELFHTQ